MRKVIIYGSIVLFVFFFLWYLSKSEYDRKINLKKYPKRIAYYIHYDDSSVFQALGSEDKACLFRINEYYKILEKGVNRPIPSCVTYSVGLDDTVYVLSEEDSLFMKVAYFSKGTSGREKYIIGYLLKRDLHEVKYSNKIKQTR